MSGVSLLNTLAALAAAPFIFGIINRTKAVFAGRSGQPLLQAYFDLVKLLRKGTVYSGTASWIFRAGPVVGLACALAALTVLPLGPAGAIVSFQGDFIVLAALLAVMRFSAMLAALDTGSSFEGMGASREAAFSVLAEPALLLGLVAIARITGSLSLSQMFFKLSDGFPHGAGPALALAAGALFVVFLAENARIPVDDPNTHLELTMIHEVMALDHGGPDLAFIVYAAALKFWILGALLSGVVLSGAAIPWAPLAGLLGLGIAVGVVESCLARLRLLRIPHLLTGAGVLSLLAFILAMV